MRATTQSILLLVASAFFVGPAPHRAAAQQDAMWSTPSDEVDSTVADWARNRLRPRSAESATPPATNPLRADAVAEEPARLAPPPSRPIEQVRYDDQRYTPTNSASTNSASTTPNPLRSAEPLNQPADETSQESSEARLAFADAAPTPAVRNPFAALPTAPSPSTPGPSEPRAFRPPAESAAPIGVPADAQPLDLRTAAEASPPAQRIASIEPPAETPPGATAQNGIRESPHANAFDRGGAFLEGVDRGTGQPGGRELEGPQQASIVVEKRGPEEARVGQTSRFVITVRNTGTATAENVVLRDEAPRGARLVQTIPSATQQDGRLLWSLGALAPGEERGVEVRVVPTEEGQVGSVASVSFETRASAALKSTRPALALKLQAPRRVPLGGQQQIQIEVHNPGSGVARNVMLLEDVPDALRHEAGPALELELGALAPGESRRLELSLTAAQAGRVVNTVTAIADGDLRAEESVDFEVVAPSLTVAVNGPDRRYLQRPAKYEVRIENPGTAPARDVRLVTHLPRGLEFVSANNLGEYDAQTHAVYWSLSELPENQSGAVEVIALPVKPGEHTLRVESEAQSGLKAAETQQLVVEGMASLAFDIRDLQDPIEVGGEAAYDVVVMNEGTKAASGVRVTVDAPGGMRVVSAQGKTPHRQTDARVEFAPIDRLEPGVKVLYRVRLRGEQAGDQRVTVAVASDDLGQPIRREESTRVFAD